MSFDNSGGKIFQLLDITGVLYHEFGVTEEKNKNAVGLLSTRAYLD